MLALLGLVTIGLPDAPAQPPAAPWAPKLYGFCMETHDAKKRSLTEQVQMLRALGFDGVGYPLWLDENLEKNLQLVRESGLDLCLLYARLNLNPASQPYDPRLPAAIAKLKGLPVTLAVLLSGLPAGDPRGDEPAVRILRQLGDWAAESGVRISIYHHTGDWTESLRQALAVVAKTRHPRVGVNFNLCHWLKVDGNADYRPLLREHVDKIFAVTINGAQGGASAWTDGLIQPLDRGDFDNRAFLDTLRQVGYRGPIGLMCYGIPGDARDHLQRSIKVWNGWKTDWAVRSER